MMRRKSRGFTLLEAVITLGILSSLLVLTVNRLPTRQHQRNAETLFWQHFDTLWKRNVLIASTSGQRRDVVFSATNNDVQFSQHVQLGQSVPVTRLTLPPTLHVLTDKKIIIYRNGHPQLAKVLLSSTLDPQHQLKFNALMGWGAYQVAPI